MEPEFKQIKANLLGIGEIEIEILQIGVTWYLTELEKFVTESDESFYAIKRTNSDFKLPIHFQRAIQAFITLLQTGGEKQTAPLMRTHFRNWINRQNGTLKTIINGYEPINASDKSAGAAGRKKIDALRNY